GPVLEMVYSRPATFLTLGCLFSWCSPGQMGGDPVTEPEESLVARARTDAQAFGALYERYVDQIYQYIYYRTGNHQDAQDLTSRTFVRALQNIHRYKQRGVPFSAWLYRIAHNLVANWHRDRTNRRLVGLDEAMAARGADTAPAGSAEKTERQQALLEAIRSLSPDRQQLLILKFAEGMSNAQIGKTMGKSEGAIKSLYHRTLVALRAELVARIQ
ncbi:MAG: sigma-70 family RNA polymerase sigma factor, partial [Anaerolineae bacterium]